MYGKLQWTSTTSLKDEDLEVDPYEMDGCIGEVNIETCGNRYLKFSPDYLLHMTTIAAVISLSSAVAWEIAAAYFYLVNTGQMKIEDVPEEARWEDYQLPISIEWAESMGRFMESLYGDISEARVHISNPFDYTDNHADLFDAFNKGRKAAEFVPQCALIEHIKPLGLPELVETYFAERVRLNYFDPLSLHGWENNATMMGTMDGDKFIPDI